eukprot:TRINITY_DN3227_c0_g1_i1.p1 TRINITY_DN3227_c0_g1~~TRINITY_DN3227_c0_g1_i1.p1  ORF type:complete len:242 (+),score=85.40 TRINITY_DN3227_c0_g1_i1:233-958(+)
MNAKAAAGVSGNHIRKHQSNLGVFIFDYNTVESVLLLCAVLVTLSGIMFESGQFEAGDSFDVQRELVTIAVLIIIFFSIIYFCLVFAAEVLGTCKAGKKKKRTRTKREKIEEAISVMKEFELSHEMGEGHLNMNPMFMAQKEALEKSQTNNKPQKLDLDEMGKLKAKNASLLSEVAQLKRMLQVRGSPNAFPNRKALESRGASFRKTKKQFQARRTRQTGNTTMSNPLNRRKDMNDMNPEQ